MKKITTTLSLLFVFVSAIFLMSDYKLNSQTSDKPASGQEIILPKPVTTGGMPLMDALRERKSSREFGAKKLPLETISNLLWAADGINREDSGKRTAPTANDTRAMDIYVLMEDGTYIYNAVKHSLEPIVNKDLRQYAGSQDFVKTAPLNLVYVEDYSKHKSQDNKEMNAGAHTPDSSDKMYISSVPHSA